MRGATLTTIGQGGGAPPSRLKFTTTIFLAGLLTFSLYCQGAGQDMEPLRKPIKEVDPDAFIQDTQVGLRGAGDDHAAMAWWVPAEFWESTLSRDESTGERERREILRVLGGTTILAVVQADISPLGAFQYYDKDEVRKGMVVAYSDENGKARRLEVSDQMGGDLAMILGIFKPVMEAAMGNLGTNMHFYLIEAGKEGRPDPYSGGALSISLVKRDLGVVEGKIKLPINSLFVPRKCPNGEDAEVSWRFCPWSGSRLD